VGFPDSDGENERGEMEKERVISGPASLLGDVRRRKDAIVVGDKRGSDCPAPPPTASPPTQSISKTLSQIPLRAWESSTPILDALIKETLRVAQPHTAMRRNMGPEFYIDGKRIQTGDYVVYPFSDVHLDEGVYPDAGRWMPGRWLAGDEEEGGAGAGKERGEVKPLGYVGWGGGEFFFFSSSWTC
jgi:cytochrome P450